MTRPRALRIKAASHADINCPQWVLFLPDWTTAQTGKGAGRGGRVYRSPPSGRNWRKTGYSWSEVTSKGNTGEEQRRLTGCAKAPFKGKLEARHTRRSLNLKGESDEWKASDRAIKSSVNRKHDNVQACSLDMLTAMATPNPELVLITVVDTGKAYLLHTALVIMDGYT